MLVAAVRKGELQRVRELLLRIVPYEQSILDEALGAAVSQGFQGGHLELARLLLDHGANPNVLFAAVQRRSLAMIDLLLERGADVHARHQGFDLLHFYLRNHSAQHDDGSIVRRLLAAGIPLSPPDPLNPHLQRACALANLSILEVLLEAGADLTAHPLLRAASESPRPSAVLERLVDAGIDANTREGELTILSAVCATGNVSAATKLLDRGANPNEGGRRTTLLAAYESGNQALLDLLLERGAMPLEAALPADVSAELDAAEAAARARPDDAFTRLAWAEVLAKHGFRAAAASEVAWLVERSAEVPEGLRSQLVFETADGARWSFASFREPRHEGVAPRIADERFRGAWVTDGTRTLPLVVTMGPVCKRCDELGEEVCWHCHGEGFFIQGMGDTIECPPRLDCAVCRALKFDVIGPRLSKGSCRHPTQRLEAPVGSYGFNRCQSCGLAAISGRRGGPIVGTDTEWACGLCGRFACVCSSASR